MRKNNNRGPIKGLSVTVDRDFNRALKLFSKKVNESGKLREVRERMEYEKPAVKKQRDKKMARKRWLKKQEQMSKESQWA
jgi:ribosomal protein S21